MPEETFNTSPEVLAAMVDALVAQRLQQLKTAPSSKGPGRPATTDDLAHLINEMKDRECSWATITIELQQLFPDRITSRDQVRNIWRRHFRKFPTK